MLASYNQKMTAQDKPGKVITIMKGKALVYSNGIYFQLTAAYPLSNGYGKQLWHIEYATRDFKTEIHRNNFSFGRMRTNTRQALVSAIIGGMVNYVS